MSRQRISAKLDRVKVAVIDLGTNSVRFDIYEIDRPGFIRSIYRDKVMVRLGQDLFKSHKLVPEAMDRCLSALKDFKKLVDKHSVEHISGGATSAAREARNGEDFIRRIKRELDFPISIISGKEEARLILKGIQAFETDTGKTFGFVDIGGGSTEVGIQVDANPIFLDSFQLGAARLGQCFLSAQPQAEEIRKLRAHIREKLTDQLAFRQASKLNRLFGSSGTVKALTKIIKASGWGPKIEREALKELVAHMSKLHQDDLMLIPGMEPKRIDIILPGAILLEELMHFIGAKEVIRTRIALREGLLQHQLEKLDLARKQNELLLTS